LQALALALALARERVVDVTRKGARVLYADSEDEVDIDATFSRHPIS
jgi:hypothetical protein